MLSNLVDNAEKYSRGAADRSLVLSAALNTSTHKVDICVRDHGPGVPGSFEGQLFKPFARAVDSGGPAGLGLGLALVRALAQAHHGTVHHKNMPDGGAFFTVTLPAG
jgi:signal transduction histidine kinase